MRNPEIDRLRALAILIVINCHLGDMRFLHYFGAGWMGVDLFFVISGYLICNGLLRLLPQFSEGPGAGRLSLFSRLNDSRKALKIFFVRRFFRIAPLVLLWLGISIGLAAWFNLSGAFGKVPLVVADAVQILTLQYNYSAALGNASGVFNQYWSLMVEEHFYLCLPFFLILFHTKTRRLAAVAVSIFLCAVVLRIYFPPQVIDWGHGFTHRKLDPLMAGVLLSLIRSWGWGIPVKKFSPFVTWPLVSFCILVLWGAETFFSQTYIHNGGMSIVWVVSAVLVYLAVLERNYILNVPFLKRVLEYVGTRSYGIYLIHLPVINFITEIRARFHLEDFFSTQGHYWLVYFGALTLTTELCYRLLEKPAIKYGGDLTKKWSRNISGSREDQVA